ncbi:MAG TPA: alpha/beta fold hydrolase [Stellaceae bacterium]|jgi:pimeloyl-ACP methyl ester carboxylesterase|nr:alpha/beta fold hydrolase [Stellaceae bacterium]
MSAQRHDINAGGAQFAAYRLAGTAPRDGVELAWAHGWGHSHESLALLAAAMQARADSWLIDLPGFGASPLPPGAWGTADYADAMAGWLATLPPRPRVWVGHSFGCRVGVQLAARHPTAVSALFLIAAAGLPPHRSAMTRIKRLPRRLIFRTLRAVTPEGPARDRLRERFGSADYRNAGAMRPVLVKAVNEDLSEAARRIRVPVVLVHGDQDTESPPEIAERFHALIPSSRLHVLHGFDHLSIISDGRHQVTHLLGELLESLR